MKVEAKTAMRQRLKNLFFIPNSSRLNRRTLSYLSFVFSSVVVLVIAISWFGEFFDFRAQRNAPKSVAGVVNFTNVDLETISALPLSGEWQAKPGALVDPEDWKTSQIPTIFLDLPGTWVDQDIDGQPLPKHGVMTYKLRVDIPPVDEPLALYVPTVGTAHSLFVDGKLLNAGGVVSDDPEMYLAGFNANIVYFTPQSDQFEIVLQVANYDYKWGGMWEYLLFGEASSLLKYRAKSQFVSTLLISMLFTVVVFNMVIFAMNRKEWVYLVVALICSLLIARELESSRLLEQVFLPDLSFLALTRVNFITFFLGVPTLYACFRISFPDEFNHKIANSIYWVCGVIALFALFTSANTFAEVLLPFQLFTIIALTYMLTNLIRAAVHQRVGARTMLFGSLVLFAISGNDLLFHMGIADTIPALPFGIAAFVFSHSFASYKRFVSTSYDNRKLAVTLSDQNQELASFSQSLERQVTKRTAELEETNRELERLAMRDSLTRVRNRLGIEAILDQAHATLQRNGSPYCLMMIDLDHFKKVNDDRGHDIGDMVLVQTAKSIAKTIRDQDIVARWGGEEFMLLLPDTELKDALFRADSVRQVVETQVSESVGFKITCSIGVAEATAEEEINEVMQRADEALYQAKEAGRNCVRVSTMKQAQGNSDE